MALYDLLLKGGTTFDPETKTFQREDVALREGKIALRAENIPQGEAAAVMDAAGCVVAPGLIDMHCHIDVYKRQGVSPASRRSSASA